MASEYLDLAGASRFKSNIDTLLNEKQDSLVSGSNIKTINNQSLLGAGNIDVSGGGGTVDTSMSNRSTNAVQNKVIKNYVDIRSILHVNYGSSSTSEDWDYIFDESVPICIDNLPVASTFPIVIAERELIQSGNAVKMYGLYNDEQVLVITASRNNGWSYEIVNIGGTIDTAMSDSSANAVQNKVIKSYVDTGLGTKANTTDLPAQATDSTLGIVKTNSAESVTLNSDGQLDIGGRLGAFSGTTGIYHSKDRAPRKVGDYSLLITDAKGMNLDAPRNFVLATGINLTLTKSHAAGSTTYTVTNNYANRIACAVLANGGYVSQSEAYSKENPIVRVTGVKINGANYTPSSAANDSSNPITITTEATGNPTQAVTQLRVFGGVTGGYCSEYIGQCVGGTVGASLVIGQRVYSSANVNCIVAADVYNTGNGNAIFGRQHISRKNRGLLAGTGHDTTNARSESVSAVGEWSDITSETLFAVGDGTDHTNRSNAFEVRDRAFVLKSPNGTKWKVAVDDNGNLTTTAI